MGVLVEWSKEVRKNYHTSRLVCFFQLIPHCLAGVFNFGLEWLTFQALVFQTEAEIVKVGVHFLEVALGL